MSEIKNVDLGSVKIHKKVIVDIVSNAVAGIKGIRLVPPSMLDQLLNIAGFKAQSAVSVDIEKTGQVSVHVRVCVDYGFRIPDVAGQAQDVIREAIEQTVDIDLKDVNVNIHGIERGDQ